MKKTLKTLTILLLLSSIFSAKSYADLMLCQAIGNGLYTTGTFNVYATHPHPISGEQMQEICNDLARQQAEEKCAACGLSLSEVTPVFGPVAGYQVPESAGWFCSGVYSATCSN